MKIILSYDKRAVRAKVGIFIQMKPCSLLFSHLKKNFYYPRNVLLLQDWKGNDTFWVDDINIILGRKCGHKKHWKWSHHPVIHMSCILGSVPGMERSLLCPRHIPLEGPFVSSFCPCLSQGLAHSDRVGITLPPDSPSGHKTDFGCSSLQLLISD